jgi:hypothetical protein
VYICNYCGDYTFRDGECSICGHPLRKATAEEECTLARIPIVATLNTHVRQQPRSYRNA